MRPTVFFAGLLSVTVSSAFVVARAIAGEPAAPRVLAAAEFRELAWEVAPTIKFVDRMELPIVGASVTLNAPKDTTIAVVVVTLRVPAAFVGTRDLPLEPGRFLALRGGAIVGAKAASLELGPGRGGTTWLLSNTNQDFRVHLGEATKTFQVAFGVPKDWKAFEVLFAAPIGAAGAAGSGGPAAPPADPKGPAGR
jgi:hypothetical protein